MLAELVHLKVEDHLLAQEGHHQDEEDLQDKDHQDREDLADQEAQAAHQEEVHHLAILNTEDHHQALQEDHHQAKADRHQVIHSTEDHHQVDQVDLQIH